MTSKTWVEVLPDGRIYSCAQVPESITPTPLQEGGEMHETPLQLNPAHYWWVGGEALYIGPAPSPNQRFNPALPGWEDAWDLAQWRVVTWARIKAARDAVEFGPFTYNGMVFDGDADAQRRLGYCIAQAREAQQTGWLYQVEFTLADNSTVMLASRDFLSLEQIKAEQVTAAFAQAQRLRTDIDQAESIEALHAIQWDPT